MTRKTKEKFNIMIILIHFCNF